MPTSYLRFDLLLDRNDAGYRARVLDSPVGQASAALELPPDFAPTAAGQTQTALQATGRSLFAVLFRAEVENCYRRSLDSARRQDAGLRIASEAELEQTLSVLRDEVKQALAEAEAVELE